MSEDGGSLTGPEYKQIYAVLDEYLRIMLKMERRMKQFPCDWV